MGQSPKGDECNSSGVGSPLLNGPTEFQLIHPSPVQWTTNPKKFSKSGDLLFCVRGSTTGRMNWSDQEYAIGRGLAAISPIHEDTMYFFRGAIEMHLPSLLAGATGSTFPNVSRSDLEAIPIPNDNLSYIKNASTILKVLESKVETNQKMNQTLEEIAKAVFNSWFVDFDPVLAKAESRPTGLPHEISDMFPVELVDSEIGVIPRGWSVSKFGELADIQNGYAFKSKDWSEEGTIPVIKIGNVKPMLVDVKSCSRVNREAVSGLERFLLSSGDTLIGMTGYVGEVGLVPNVDEMPYLNQRVGRIIANSPSDYSFIVTLARRKEFKVEVENLSTGSAQANVSTSDIKSIKVVLPSSNLREKFGDLINPIFDRMLIANKEIEVLSKLRDTLLPKFISGELRIPNVEMLLEEAGI